MVTELVKRQVEQQEPLNFEQFGELLGIPITVRPWWGSVRRRGRRFHKKCGNPLSETVPGYCLECHKGVDGGEVLIKEFEREWLCSVDGSSIKAPEVQKGRIILWEGPCGHHSHNRKIPHSQETKIRDVQDRVMLISIWVRQYFSNWLIGVDGRAPFVVPILRRHMKVQEAFDWLMPVKVKRAIATGLEVKRQGDWFFIPVSDEPKHCELRAFARTWQESVPFSNPPLARHVLYEDVSLIYGEQTRHRAEQAVYNAVVGIPHVCAPFVRGRVYAPDHEDLQLESWYLAVRNKCSTGGRRDNARGQDD